MVKPMDVEQMVITDENDMYLYFWLAEELKPASILDVGMLLKRVGGVSRQLKQKEIGAEVRLDGIDTFPEIQCPVWDMVYDHIYTAKEFCVLPENVRYGLVYMMRLGEGYKDSMAETLWSRILEYAECVVADVLPPQYESYWSQGERYELTVENKSYWIVKF